MSNVVCILKNMNRLDKLALDGMQTFTYSDMKDAINHPNECKGTSIMTQPMTA